MKVTLMYFCRKWILFFTSRRRHTRSLCDWSSDVCSSDLNEQKETFDNMEGLRKHIMKEDGKHDMESLEQEEKEIEKNENKNKKEDPKNFLDRKSVV